LGNGLFNVLVFLDANKNGIWEDNEIYTFTDVNGKYEFDNLAAGLGDLSTYNVFLIPNGNYTTGDQQPLVISLDDCEAVGTANFTLNPGAPNS
jgi:hypothetical protein